MLLLFGLSPTLFSQISVVPSSGCMPQGLTNAIFTYTGSGTPTNIVWDYGDGTPTSTLTTTQHSYPNIGNYTVTFSALIGGSPVTYTYPVTVSGSPTGAFTAAVPANHCTGMSVNFVATTAANNVTFNWAFGDLVGGTGSPVTHVYQSAGSFTPNVTIQNTLTGCFVTVSGSAINVSSPPSLIISASPGQFTCSPSFTVVLNASSSSANSPLPGGGLTYNWNLGIFGASTQTITNAIVFTPVGAYGVTLTATDNNNCSASTTTTISLLSPTVLATVPASVCIQSQMSFSPSVFSATVNANQPSSTWDMGDGNVVTFPIPLPPPMITPILIPNTAYSSTIHSYTSPGLKTLTITVTAAQCVATITRTIFVEEITPAFTTPLPHFTCNNSLVIPFANQTTVNSSSSLTYTWNVPQWNYTLTPYSSGLANPVFTVTQTSPNPYANFAHPPYYVAATMTIVSQPLGCIAFFSRTLDTIQRPSAMFEVDQAEGCVPLTVSFTNTSVSHTTGVLGVYPITSYTWDMGVSPAVTFSGNTLPIQSPIFTYSNVGTYHPVLTIQTAGGCGHTSYPHTITVVSPPSISYTLPGSSTCAGQLYPFPVNLAAGPTQTVQHWHVEGDLGYSSSCVSDANPILNFSHPGVYSFTISAYQNSCKTSSVTTPVTVNGPIGKLRYETNCTGNRKSVKFYYRLEDVEFATINYGDGTTENITGSAGGVVAASPPAAHIYSATGNYLATLTCSNSLTGCNPYTFTVMVVVRNITASFVFTNTVICKGSYLSLNAISSVNVFTNAERGYSWYIDNDPPQQSSTYTYISNGDFSLVGMHTVKLVVKDTNGCVDSQTKSFRVSSPAPNFQFNANPICFSNMPLQLTNLTPQTPDSVSDYKWFMGDSMFHSPLYHTILTGTVPNHSPTFSYATLGGSQSQTFTVTLVAKNSLGCSSYFRQTLVVNDPKIFVSADKYTGCAPQTRVFSFVAASTHTNYSVNYGDGPVGNISTFTSNNTYTAGHTYMSAGSYTPVFTVTDFGGCSKSVTLTTMDIQAYPVATFTFENRMDHKPGPGPFCAPFSPSTTSTTQSLYPLTYVWNLGLTAAMTTTLATATDNYPETEGNYTLSLKVITRPGGCSSYTQIPVVVFSPKIEFAVEPDSLKKIYCLGDPINLKLTSFSGLQSGYQWDFGDGVVRPRSYPVNTIPATLQFTYPNTFYPEQTNGELSIELTGYAGQQPTICSDVKRKIFQVVKVLPNFKRNGESLGVDSIHCFGKSEVFENKSTSTLNSPLTYTWTLSDGTLETSTDVTHTFPAAGTYTVKLSALETEHGCIATVSKKMVIFPLPVAGFSIIPFSCPATPFLINGSGSPGISGTLGGTLQPGPIPLTFDSSNNFSVSTTASVSTTYTLKVVDSNGCENAAASASILIQQPAPEIHWDTTVVIGAPIPLNAYVAPGFSYTWTQPSPFLNCDPCLIYNPISSSSVNITYSVSVEDGHQCSVVKNTYRVNIDLKVSLDVPSAFTPNGDGVNDVILPGGWGLKKLNYFKVFNRWGQLVFESNDLSVGWNGIYQGVPQNIETYVYQVSAETYLDSEPTLTKTGTFKLLR